MLPPAYARLKPTHWSSYSDTRIADKAITMSPTLPLELVLDTLKLSLEGHRSGSVESKRALYTYSLISKGVSGWAQKKLFTHVCLTDQSDALDCPDILRNRPELGASVQVLELGGDAWSVLKYGEGGFDELLTNCPAYHRGELTLKLSSVAFNFGKLFDVAYSKLLSAEMAGSPCH